MFLDVVVMSPQEVLFEGRAQSVKLPGEQGAFEVLPFHKRIISRLVSGVLFVDERGFNIVRGIIKVDQNKASIIIEEAL